MLSVKYTGTPTDYSGYGAANRAFIIALFASGVDITTEIVVQVPERAKFGWGGELCRALQDKQIDYKTKIIHLTPDCYPRYLEEGKYNIGHLFWETNKLPNTWIEPCNMMDEIWTASEQQALMIRRSGVNAPINWFPQPINILPSQKEIEPYKIHSFKGYIFYSIFQWIERKNPQALLFNYWKTFRGKEDVILILKTYGITYTSDEFDKIKAQIKAWKRELKQDHYPRVLLVKKLMTQDEIFRLHATGDCYINASRGEGWCIPAVEAGMMGNPLISNEITGFADYMPRDCFYPCGYKQVPVTEQSWIPWYTADQEWLNINEKDLAKNMLSAYNHQEVSKEVGKKAQKYIRENWNYWKVGQAMKERLEEIEKI